MIRDLLVALLLLGLGTMPLAPAAAAGDRFVCTGAGAAPADSSGGPGPDRGGPDLPGCAHLLCPSRESRPGHR